ncbi:glucomannan 4-beta-mannosyltransferase 9-like protein [Tanacetum coccineum]
MGSDGIPNDATPRVDAAMMIVSPSVVEENVAMECPVVNTPGVGPNPPPSTQEANAPAGNTPGEPSGKPSYAIATGKPNGKKVKVHTLYTPGGNGIDMVVLVESIRAISKQFDNTAYGFCLGKKVAYPVVASYVMNTWGKYGLVRSMFSSSTGLFSFKFSSIDGLDAMLENGPWFIRNNPLILKKWHLDENLLKKDVSIVLVWVKLHGVPVTAFNEDGLSAIATKLGTPLMLDSYTSDMCMQSWGRSSYARVMIELRANVELKDNIVVAMPKITREGHYTFTRNVRRIQVLFGTNGGTTNLVNNEATSSGSAFMNIDNDGEFASNTPIVPTGIMESDSEVEVVFDDTANLRIPTSGKDGSDKSYGTNSLLEQWRDSYPDNDDYDPYDDDMYENHDLSEHLQSICDDLDITVRGRKKK